MQERKPSIAHRHLFDSSFVKLAKRENVFANASNLIKYLTIQLKRDIRVLQLDIGVILRLIDIFSRMRDSKSIAEDIAKDRVALKKFCEEPGISPEMQKFRYYVVSRWFNDGLGVGKDRETAKAFNNSSLKRGYSLAFQERGRRMIKEGRTLEATDRKKGLKKQVYGALFLIMAWHHFVDECRALPSDKAQLPDIIQFTIRSFTAMAELYNVAGQLLNNERQFTAEEQQILYLFYLCLAGLPDISDISCAIDFSKSLVGEYSLADYNRMIKLDNAAQIEMSKMITKAQTLQSKKPRSLESVLVQLNDSNIPPRCEYKLISSLRDNAVFKPFVPFMPELKLYHHPEAPINVLEIHKTLMRSNMSPHLLNDLIQVVLAYYYSEFDPSSFPEQPSIFGRLGRSISKTFLD